MSSKSDVALIRSFVESDRRAIITATLASAVSGVSSALLIAFVGKQFLDATTFDALEVLQFGGLLALTIATSLFASKVLIKASSEYSYALRLSLCRRILSTDFDVIEKIGSPRLMAMLTENLTEIASAFFRIPVLSADLARVLFCLGYLLWLAPIIVLCVMLLSIPLLIVQILLYRKAKFHMRELLPLRDRRFTLYESMTNGFKELRLNRVVRNRFFNGQLKVNASRFKIAQQETFMANQYAVNWGQSAYFLIILGVLVAASYDLLSIEVVAVFALVGLFIRSSIFNLVQAVPLWMRASVAYRTIELLKLPLENAKLFFPADIGISGGSGRNSNTDRQCDVKIELKAVTFCYTSEQSVTTSKVGPVSLELTSGEVVFLTGGNGSGKTTVIKLLTTLYEPTSGHILFNGQAINEDNVEDYRSNLHCIYSDFHLFDEWLHASDIPAGESLSDYLDRLNLDQPGVSNLSDIGYAQWSSGQRSRVALLPLLLIEKPILIFDEWAAHQDPEFKQKFYKQLLPEFKRQNRLVIVITHDDRYFDSADRIIRFESGRVLDETLVQQGSGVCSEE